MKIKILLVMVLLAIPFLSFGQLSSPIKTDGNEQPVMRTTAGATNGAMYICTNQATGEGKWSVPVGFKAVMTGTFTFTNAIRRTIAWDSEIFDYGNNFNGTNFVAPVNGIYNFVWAICYWDRVSGSTETYVLLDIKVNDTTVANEYSFYTVATAGWAYLVTGPTYLTNGAIVNCSVLNAHGSNTNRLQSNPAGCTYFSGDLVREIP